MMIRIIPINNKRVEVSWDTGTEYQLLCSLSIIIQDRNNLKIELDGVKP